MTQQFNQGFRDEAQKAGLGTQAPPSPMWLPYLTPSLSYILCCYEDLGHLVPPYFSSGISACLEAFLSSWYRFMVDEVQVPTLLQILPGRCVLGTGLQRPKLKGCLVFYAPLSDWQGGRFPTTQDRKNSAPQS